VEESKTATITNELQDSISVFLHSEDSVDAAVLTIDGIKYHFERIDGAKLTSDYKVDLDRDYNPQLNSAGYCYILAPFSK
jgi:hypothetical protein